MVHIWSGIWNVIRVFGLALFLVSGSVLADPIEQPDDGDAAANPFPHILVIAPDPSSDHAKALVHYLNARFPLKATLVPQTEYRSHIDAWVHDGFVYLGENYFLPPSAAFFQDMAQTEKPLLWINYHAWNLSEDMKKKTGLTVFDQRDLQFGTVNFHALAPLEGADVSATMAEYPAQVLYWIFNADLTASTPGAVISGNLSYLSYLPVLDPDHPSFPAFHAAADAAMSQLTRLRPQPLDDATRLSAAKADAFRSGIHLPFILDPDADATVTYDAEDFHRRLMNIKMSGAEWVNLTQTYFQNGVAASNPAAHAAGTATNAALRNIVDDAHALGLFVRLSIIVNLNEASRRPDDWRGYIRPANPDKWWATYRRIVLDAARFSQTVGIESLVIGAELNRMQVDEPQWRALVSDVRSQVGYKGLLGYQVNFDSFDSMTWADALDFLSVAAYWPLAKTADPSLETLKAAWEKVGKMLSDWSQAHPGVPLELGEIGYTSQPYAAVFPFSWKPNRSQNLSLTEQFNAYLALEEFLRARNDIAGVGIFASTQYDRVPGDIGYSPFGKPAEQVVKRLMDLRQ